MRERALIPCFREVGQRDGQRDGLDFNNLSSFRWISAVGGFLTGWFKNLWDVSYFGRICGALVNQFSVQRFSN